MARPSYAPAPPGRRVYVRPAPVRRARFRWLRRLLKLVVLLGLVLLAAWIYVLQVYAPGLRTEARSVPARIRAQLAAQGARYVVLQSISPNLRAAIVSVEDRRFYEHPGIDPIGMVRAVWINLTNGSIDQGGSTLEQQLAKRAIVHDDRSVRAKLRTVGLAWAIDQEFSKARILELYLNAAYYGRGAYGADAAARVYFGTDASRLSVAQGAFLAALPQAPSVYGANPTSAVVLDRWRQVLQDMRDQGYITRAQQQEALTHPLTFAFPPA